MNQPIDKAIVLGASVAGLLAARALSENCRQVLIIERDQVRGVIKPRRGVPQGPHVHGLLARGQQILEEYFDGFTEQARAAGIPTADLGELRWFFNGRRLKPAPTGLTCVSADRPVLEDLIRRNVLKIPNIELAEEHSLLRYVFADDSNTQISAVEVLDSHSGKVSVSEADLVVDCTGRGSRTSALLESAGYSRPETETVPIGLSYTSRHYQVQDESLLEGDMSVNPVSCPQHPRGAFFSRVQNGRSIVSLTGMRGDPAPTDPEKFQAWADGMAVPDVADIIRAGTPLDDPVVFKFPESRRQRYDQLERFPDGLLVIGDAFCSFNPVYGQGMTVAALESLVLREATRAGAPTPREFHQQIGEVVEGPWAQSTSGDLEYFDDVERTEEMQQANAYMALVQKAASADPEVTRVFMRIAGLVDPPSNLMTPEMQERIMQAAQMDGYQVEGQEAAA